MNLVHLVGFNVGTAKENNGGVEEYTANKKGQNYLVFYKMGIGWECRIVNPANKA